MRRPYIFWHSNRLVASYVNRSGVGAIQESARQKPCHYCARRVAHGRSALYGLVSLLTWLAYRAPGLPSTLQAMAKGIGVSTPQLLEFNAIIVAAVFAAVQLWTTHRRADAAENTASAAIRTRNLP